MFARTERLLLRPSWPEDAQELHQAIADEAIVRNLARAPWPHSIDDAVRFATMSRDERYPAFLLMLRTNGAPKLIGACGLGEHDGEAELGYWIARPYWGLGFATEAGQAVIDIAKAIGHKALVASHFTDNPASARVLRKLGFRDAGKTAQRHSRGRGAPMTCALYDMAMEDKGNVRGDVNIGAAFTTRAYLANLQAA